MNIVEESLTIDGLGIGSGSRELLQRILATTRQCVLAMDRETRVIGWNAAAQDIFSRNGRIAGRRLSEIVRDLDLHEAFRRALSSGLTSEVRLELIDTERRKFDVHVAPIELDGRNCAIGFFYETTRIDRLESVRQEFLSNISHELRTPLTSILAFVETLEDGAMEDVENNRRFLTVIRRNAERMSTLIADILELSLIESGKVSVDPRNVRLHEMVDEIFASLRTKAASRDVTLFNDVQPGTAVFADVIRLEQMLVNLIDNAIKFNRESGSVVVAHSREAGRDLITVADSGEGILPEHLSRIFERFYRVDKARSRDMGGTGLGLSIVKHLARLHGGEVSVRSVLSEGTTFQIELPVHAPDHSSD
ncbi:MAG: PAS domain-containing protein [Acidobacteria bacterium]|nr:PAS domain-containing protein [Acidobacteriota bacterium]MCW5948084.1 PAS domain-containing protein [Pyrinomonadaceae bacterium]